MDKIELYKDKTKLFLDKIELYNDKTKLLKDKIELYKDKTKLYFVAKELYKDKTNAKWAKINSVFGFLDGFLGRNHAINGWHV